jgi:hypothetical protein
MQVAWAVLGDRENRVARQAGQGFDPAIGRQPGQWGGEWARLELEGPSVRRLDTRQLRERVASLEGDQDPAVVRTRQLLGIGRPSLDP